MTTQTCNDLLLTGTALEPPVLSHENHGARFYRFPLEVPRLSGQSDVLPVLLPENLLLPLAPGSPVQIRGQLRSFNNRSGVGSRLVLSVYAQAVEIGDGTPRNHIRLSGSLCKPPVYRRTPLGRSICDMMLAVPRRYGRADYLPAIAWGQLAARCGTLQVGDALALEGRVQSRAYKKVTEAGTQDRVAYEVSIMHLLEPEDV